MVLVNERALIDPPKNQPIIGRRSNRENTGISIAENLDAILLSTTLTYKLRLQFYLRPTIGIHIVVTLKVNNDLLISFVWNIPNEHSA